MSISSISAAAVQPSSQTHPSIGLEAPSRRNDASIGAPTKKLLAPNPIQANSASAPKSLTAQALEESIETAVDTAKEARAGDPLAQRLERKLAAARSNATAPPSNAPHATGTGVGGIARAVMQANPGIQPNVLASAVEQYQVTMGCRTAPLQTQCSWVGDIWTCKTQ